MRTAIPLLLSVFLQCCGVEPTLGDRFAEFGGAYCGRQIECDLMSSDDRRMCIDDELASACFDGRDCTSRDYYLNEDLWGYCLSALDEYDCTKVARGLAPADCANAWRPPGQRL